MTEVMRFLIYGATGYTGRLLAKAAIKRGLHPIVAGRDADRVKLLANQLSIEARVFQLDDLAALHEGLRGVGCLINAAGPISESAESLIDECIERKVHYLSVSGSLGAYEYAERSDERAQAAGVMLMPGVGWDVVATDCLALHTSRRVEQPHTVRLFVRHVDIVPTHGSLRSMEEFFQRGRYVVRCNGTLTQLSESPVRYYDFGFGAEPFQLAPMADVIAIWKTSKIPNIEIYTPDMGDAKPLTNEQIEKLPEGGNEEETARAYSLGLAEVVGADEKTVRSLIRTKSGYAYTAEAGVEVARRVMIGEFKPGFQSPAGVYGPQLATSIGEGKIIDIA